MMCRCAYSQELLIQFFSWELHPFELRNFAKMKYTTETVCQPNCSETAQQNLVKLYCSEVHTVYMCIFAGMLIHLFW